MQDPKPKIGKSALNSTVFRLGLVSLFADISSEMLYPITPVFLTAVLGASMANIGIIEGCAEGVASLLKTYSGFWSDRIEKRRPFVFWGYCIAALSKPLIGISTSWAHVLAARSFDRVGKGVRSAPRDAMLADSVDAGSRGAAFGWHRAMDTLGAAIGPLFAILYLHLAPGDLRKIYLLALVPGILAALIVLSVREIQPLGAKPAKAAGFSWRWRDLGRDYKYYLFSWGVFSLANSSDVFLILRTQKIGGSLTTTILLYCLYNLCYSLLSPSLGSLSDRIGRKKILVFGLLVFAAVYTGFAFANQLWQVWILFGIYGIYMAATDGVGKALAVDLMPKEWKATGVGILGTVTGVATIFASVLAGELWDHVSPEAPFLYGALGAFLAAAMLWRLREPSERAF